MNSPDAGVEHSDIQGARTGCGDSGGVFSRRKFIGIAGAALAAAASPVAPQSQASSLANDITWMPGVKLAQLIAAKHISPVEVAHHFLSRIEAIDPEIHAYITVDAQGAIAQAKILERMVMRGDPLGPLHGLPISIKDLLETRGLRTTYGSRIFKDFIPEKDEIQIERLRAAGAIIIGKTNTSEFGKFPRTRTLVGGETLNPWNTGRISGASSGGSCAAVAAGISCLAIASDGGGSTRIPACFNGVFGLQPSAGRVPMRKPKKVVMSSTGPATWHVEDAALIMSVIGGPDARDPSAIERPNPDFMQLLGQGMSGSRVAWTPDFGRIPTLDGRVVEGVAAAVSKFADAGAEIEMPSLRLPDNTWDVFWALNASAAGDMLSGLSKEHFDLLTPPLQALLDKINSFGPMTASSEVVALEKRAGLQEWADSVFEKYDLICSPTTNMIAPVIPGGWEQPYAHPLFAEQISTPFTHIANILGLPAASIPCGFVDGMPIGMQVIARRHDDVKVLQAARVFAELQPWMNKHPVVAEV